MERGSNLFEVNFISFKNRYRKVLSNTCIFIERRNIKLLNKINYHI